MVDILGSIDNSIENNEAKITKIEELALLKIRTNNNSKILKPYIKFIKGKKPLESGTSLDDYLSIEGITSANYQKAYSDNMILANPFDILMVMDGASSGTVYSHQKGIVSSTLAKIEVPQNVNDYLYWFLLSMKDIIKTRNTGSAIPHANKDYIENLSFDYTLATNKNLTTELHDLRLKIIDIKRNNAKLKELKSLYLKKFFD